MADSDNDRVNDENDRCPSVAGLKENNGCPEVKQKVIKKLRIQGLATSYTLSGLGWVDGQCKSRLHKGV